MKTVNTTIVENRQISPDFFLLRFEWKAEWGVPKPGNFLELKVSGGTAPLLRRPFAFSGYDAATEVAEMVYQIRGESTGLLSEKKAGDDVKIIGPIGNEFTIPESASKVFAIAGGVGLGPILFAAKEANKEVVFVTGFRNVDMVPDRSVFDGIDAVICTDDGSDGFAGNTVQYLGTLSKDELEGGIIWSCGPTPMLKACHTFAQENNMICEVSMEEMMACGIGACMGCVIEITEEPGLARVCKEGPIFNSEVVKWN